MRIETVTQVSDGTWKLGLVGTKSEMFRSVTLSAAELATLQFQELMYGYRADAALFRLGVQAYLLGIALEFDPYFGAPKWQAERFDHRFTARGEPIFRKCKRSRLVECELFHPAPETDTNLLRPQQAHSPLSANR
jgi:hypothetical protein